MQLYGHIIESVSNMNNFLHACNIFNSTNVLLNPTNTVALAECLWLYTVHIYTRIIHVPVTYPAMTNCRQQQNVLIMWHTLYM